MAALLASSAAHGATARQEAAGALADKRPIEAITLANGHVSARIVTYGATL